MILITVITDVLAMAFKIIYSIIVKLTNGNDARNCSPDIAGSLHQFDMSLY